MPACDRQRQNRIASHYVYSGRALSLPCQHGRRRHSPHAEWLDLPALWLVLGVYPLSRLGDKGQAHSRIMQNPKEQASMLRRSPVPTMRVGIIPATLRVRGQMIRADMAIFPTGRR